MASIAIPHREAIPRSHAMALSWVWLLPLALLIRLVPALVLNRGAGYDINSYWLVGQATTQHLSVYTPALYDHYPYLPVQLWLSAGVYLLSTWSLLPFVTLIKVPAILADTAIVPMLLYGLQRHGSARATAKRAALLYACNPVSVLVISAHGQFDSIPLLCLIGAWALLPPGREHYAWAGVLIGLAILTKTWPVFLVPAFVVALRRRNALRLLAGVLFVPATGTLLYAALYGVSPLTILARVAGYSGVAGYWGLSIPVSIMIRAGVLLPASLTLLAHIGSITLVVGVLAAAWYTRTWSLEARCLVSVLAIYLCSVAIAGQYLLWIVPFGLLVPEMRFWWMRYCLGASAVLASVYFLEGGITARLLSDWQGYPVLGAALALALYGLIGAWLHQACSTTRICRLSVVNG